MLPFFSELFRPATPFLMKPKVVGGYEERVDEPSIVGVLLHLKAPELGIESHALSERRVPTFFTQVTLSPKSFLNIAGRDYKVANDGNIWDFEGGFNVYLLQNIIGTTDIQQPNEDIDFGRSDYD